MIIMMTIKTVAINDSHITNKILMKKLSLLWVGILGLVMTWEECLC